MAMFIHEAYIDLDGKTYRLGKLIMNDQDFSQYPVLELLSCYEDKRVGVLPIFNITSRMCRPLKGIFENPSNISRTVIGTVTDFDKKLILVRTSRNKSKGDMLEII